MGVALKSSPGWSEKFSQVMLQKGGTPPQFLDLITLNAQKLLMALVILI